MKECKYCRSMYDDNLTICPNCGGNKIITAEERAEEAGLRQKEIENREEAIAAPVRQRKMILGIIAAALVVVFVVVGIASYNANKPLSNGMTQDQGEAVLTEGMAYYKSGEYEKAIACLVQLPSDSKQYEDAQKVIQNSATEYKAAILTKTDIYMQNKEYEVALALLNAAKALLPEDIELSSAYNSCYATYKDAVCVSAIAAANEYVSTSDYPSAIATLNDALVTVGNSAELEAKLVTLTSEYKSLIIKKADDIFADTGYIDAIEAINEGLAVLNDDSELLSKIDEYNSHAPVFLAYEDAYATNKFLRTEISDYSWLTDNYGTTYVSNRVICNKDWSPFTGEGTIQYYLESQYQTLTGTIYVPDVSKGINIESRSVVGLPYVQVWGDDVLLYELNSLSSTDKPVDFSVDISNVEFVIIKIYGGWYRGDGTGLIPMNCVADLAVAK